MKIVVDEMPKHHWDCLFCKGIIDECILSKRYCHGVNSCEALVVANKNEQKNGKRQQAKGEPPCMRREDKPKEELK